MKGKLSVLLVLTLALPLCACAKTYTAEEIPDIREAAFDYGYTNGYDDGYEEAQGCSPWDKGEFLSEMDDAIAPIKHARNIIETYFDGDSDSVDLDELYFLLDEGLYNLAMLD